MRRSDPRSSTPRHGSATRALAGVAVVAATLGILVFGALPHPAMAGGMYDVAQPTAQASMVPHAAQAIPVSDGLKRVLQGLLCQCGCNLDAYGCQQTMTCRVSSAMWRQASRLVDREGKTPSEALQLFAADYGEYVLASPTKRGFNLTVWVLPFVALLMGGGALAYALRRWRRVPAPVEAMAPAVDPAVLARIERDLEED